MSKYQAKWKPYVIVELCHDSRISIEDEKFVGPADRSDECKQLNQCTQKARATVTPHFPLTKKALKRRIQKAPKDLSTAVDSEFAMAGFVKIQPANTDDCDLIAKQFQRINSVWLAYTQGRSKPAGTQAVSLNLEPIQGYLNSAPAGLGIKDAWMNYPAARGQDITVCDIEGDWNLQHEDLPDAIEQWGGVRTNIQEDFDHGTAVLGILNAQPGNTGTLGVCPDATIKVQSDYYGDHYSTSCAIYSALTRLYAGDIILLETETLNSEPIQIEQASRCAIRTAVDLGIVVVEAAGNGGLNLDGRKYNNTGAQKDIGAIVVGAGVPSLNYRNNYGQIDTGYLGMPRARLPFSNHGQIVNLQAWGENVAAPGYGNALGGAENRWYTMGFGGTSSASALVAGMAACVQAYALKEFKKPLSPRELRTLLISTGDQQVLEDEENGDFPGRHIGPQPSMYYALLKLADRRGNRKKRKK